jgi:hypothetical protein
VPCARIYPLLVPEPKRQLLVLCRASVKMTSIYALDIKPDWGSNKNVILVRHIIKQDGICVFLAITDSLDHLSFFKEQFCPAMRRGSR